MIAQTMLDGHHALAWVLIVSNASVGVWAAAAHRWPRLRGRPFQIALVVAFATVMGQAVTGAVLIRRDHLEPARLHALYGFSAVIAVGIVASYRASPGMKGKEHLLYAGGCLFIMGLGLRELVLTTR